MTETEDETCRCGREAHIRGHDMEATCAECRLKPGLCECEPLGSRGDASTGDAARQPKAERALSLARARYRLRRATRWPYAELDGTRYRFEGGDKIALRADLKYAWRKKYPADVPPSDGVLNSVLADLRRLAMDAEPDAPAAQETAELDGDGAELAGDGSAEDSSPGSAGDALDITEEPEAVRLITEAINDQRFAEVFMRGDVLTQVATGEKAVLARELNDAILRRLIADNVSCVKRTPYGQVVGALPMPVTCKAILALQQWPKVRRLRGIANFPVPLGDGTILQEPGYHTGSGLFLPEGIGVPPVPDNPTATQVKAALDFILDKYLEDFPWTCPADKANALAALITPLLREIIRDVFPLGYITAPERGSGKTLLAELVNMIYNTGADLRILPADEKEIEKTITSALRGAAPVIVFDNVTQTIRSASLAALLTMRNWTARILGGSRDGTYPNDRLWMCTGTNVSLGGDFAQRSFRIAMDYRKPNPDLRTGFQIPEIKAWTADHRGEVLWYLLILIRAWQLDGARRAEQHIMRGFTPWAQVAGGVLAYHGIEGFLANRDEVIGQDDDAADMARYLCILHSRYGDTGRTARQILADAATDRALDDALPPTLDGGRWTTRALGKLMASHEGKYYGQPLRTLRHKVKQDISWWRVEEWTE